MICLISNFSCIPTAYLYQACIWSCITKKACLYNWPAKYRKVYLLRQKVSRRSLMPYVVKFYGRLRLIRSVWEQYHFPFWIVPKLYFSGVLTPSLFSSIDFCIVLACQWSPMMTQYPKRAYSPYFFILSDIKMAYPTNLYMCISHFPFVLII